MSFRLTTRFLPILTQPRSSTILGRANVQRYSTVFSSDKPEDMIASHDSFDSITVSALRIIVDTLRLMNQNRKNRENPPKIESYNDMLMGLLVLARHNTMKGLSRPAKTLQTIDREILVPKLLRYVRLCDAVYASSPEEFANEANIPHDAIVRSVAGGVFVPTFQLVVDHQSAEIQLIVRGSASFLDFLTDICLLHEPFHKGHGHRGIVLAADRLIEIVLPDLQQQSVKYSQYNIVVMGHSLGAGISALAAIKLKETFPSIKAIAFAAPPSLCLPQSIECESYVTTIINQDDCVPRFHERGLLALQHQLSSFDWRSELDEMVNNHMNQQVEEFSRSIKRAAEAQKDSLFQSWPQIEESLAALEKLSAQIKTPSDLADVRRKASSMLSNALHAAGAQDAKVPMQEFRQKMDKILDQVTEQSRDKFQLKMWEISELASPNYFFRKAQSFASSIKELRPNFVSKFELPKLPFVGSDIKQNSTNLLSKFALSRNLSDSSTEADLKSIAKENSPPCPLYLPGKLVYLHMGVTKNEADISEASRKIFDEIVVSDVMMQNHLCTEYERVLKSA